MSYCVNPGCPHPQNPADSILQCQTCGARLLLRARYRVMEPLGQGGFGATFLAKDISLPGQPSCVVKQLRPSSLSARVLEMAGAARPGDQVSLASDCGPVVCRREF